MHRKVEEVQLTCLGQFKLTHLTNSQKTGITVGVEILATSVKRGHFVSAAEYNKWKKQNGNLREAKSLEEALEKAPAKAAKGKALAKKAAVKKAPVKKAPTKKKAALKKKPAARKKPSAASVKSGGRAWVTMSYKDAFRRQKPNKKTKRRMNDDDYTDQAQTFCELDSHAEKFGLLSYADEELPDGSTVGYQWFNGNCMDEEKFARMHIAENGTPNESGYKYNVGKKTILAICRAEKGWNQEEDESCFEDWTFTEEKDDEVSETSSAVTTSSEQEEDSERDSDDRDGYGSSSNDY